MGNMFKQCCEICFKPSKAPKVMVSSTDSTDDSIYVPPKKSYNKTVILTPNDFKVKRLIGRGAFGKVLLVEKIDDKKLYAMKILKKEQIKLKNQQINSLTERKILEIITNPFILKLHFAFQDHKKLYLVTEFAQGGDLFYHLKREKYFSEKKAIFYLCELILALEGLHENNIIYRDLKPENILICKDGHIKLTDFGLSKIFKSNISNARTNSICGSLEYIAPEIARNKEYDRSVDMWSLGVVFYQMLAGFTPFYKAKLSDKINIDNYLAPIEHQERISNKAYNFIKLLLEIDPQKRLGYKKGFKEIKEHPFLKGIQWDNFILKKENPPYLPYFQNDEDLAFFDEVFTKEDPNSQKNLRFTIFPDNANEGITSQTEVFERKINIDEDNKYANFTYVNENYLSNN